MMLKTLSLAIAVSLGSLVTSAHADKGETRLSLHGAGSLASFSAFDSSSSSQLYGGGFGMAHGPWNWLELNLVANYQRRGDVVIDGAGLGGVGGPNYQLYTDLQAADIGVGGRLFLELGPFLRLRPLLGGRIGYSVAQYAKPALFLEGAPISTGDTEWEFEIFTALEAGIDYRLSDSFATSLAFSKTSGVQDSWVISLEFSWLSYWF